MLSHENCFKKNSNPGKCRSKLPETFTHGTICYSRFSKNSVKNITFVATRKPTKRILKLITGNMHFCMHELSRVANNKLLQICWLNTTKIYSHTVVETEVQNQCVCRIMFPLKALGKNPFLLLPGFCWLPTVIGGPRFIVASL